MITHADNPSVKPGCVAPALGNKASQALGRPLSGDVRDHVAVCLACQIENLAFDSLDAYRVAPSRELVQRVQQTCRQAGSSTREAGDSVSGD